MTDMTATVFSTSFALISLSCLHDCEKSAVMFFLEFSVTDFAEYENEHRVIQLLTVLNTLSVKWEGIQ